MELIYKEEDKVFIVILAKGKITIQGQLVEPPHFITVEGIVKSIYKPTRVSITFLSIEIPNCPLRYLQEPANCFKTKEEADKAAAEKTSKLNVNRPE